MFNFPVVLAISIRLCKTFAASATSPKKPPSPTKSDCSSWLFLSAMFSEWFPLLLSALRRAALAFAIVSRNVVEDLGDDLGESEAARGLDTPSNGEETVRVEDVEDTSVDLAGKVRIIFLGAALTRRLRSSVGWGGGDRENNLATDGLCLVVLGA